MMKTMLKLALYCTLLSNTVLSRTLRQDVCKPVTYDMNKCSLEKLNTCNSCLGKTDCCADVNSLEYFGRCADSSNTCPDGSTFTCNGGDCPQEISCKYVSCDDKMCWGVTRCKDGNCPNGYYDNMFCHQDGSSDNFKVCCGLVDLTTSSPPPPPTKPEPKYFTNFWCDNNLGLVGDKKFEPYTPYLVSGWAKPFKADSMKIKESGEYNSVYQKECASNDMTYLVPVNEGCYNVTVYNAEIYFVCYDGERKRVFNMFIQGEQVENELDLFTKIGPAHAFQTQKFVYSTDYIKLQFVAVVDLAKFAGVSVELVDKSFCA